MMVCVIADRWLSRIAECPDGEDVREGCKTLAVVRSGRPRGGKGLT